MHSLLLSLERCIQLIENNQASPQQQDLRQLQQAIDALRQQVTAKQPETDHRSCLAAFPVSDEVSLGENASFPLLRAPLGYVPIPTSCSCQTQTLGSSVDQRLGLLPMTRLMTLS